MENLNKQIEEMIKIAEQCSCVYVPCENECAQCSCAEMYDDTINLIARSYYEAGYRKASDVAEEIFAEIDKRLDDITIVMGVLDSLRTFHKTIEKVTAEIAELKKEYTEGK